MNYEALYNWLPVSEEGKMVLGLETMEALMTLLDHPEDNVPVIHIAGTNGKGSTALFISTILRKAGYRVGLFTSPSLIAVNERINIDGEDVSDEQLIAAAQTIQQVTRDQQLTFTEFELFTALAFELFDQENCDIAVVEVGLGGRLDATNIVARPELTVITKIGLDHQSILGTTYSDITYEKAGIIKPGVPVVAYPQETPAEVTDILQSVTKERSARLNQVALSDLTYELSTDRHQSFQYKAANYNITLLEEHQIKNAAVAIEVCLELQKQGWQIPGHAIEQGLIDTKWPARFEWIMNQPNVVIDGSHNEDGLIELHHNIKRYFPTNRRVAIVGFLRDKAIAESLQRILPLFETIICTTPQSSRALEASECSEMIEALSSLDKQQIKVASDYESAINQAFDQVGADDVICVFGSLYFTGIIRQLIKSEMMQEDNT